LHILTLDFSNHILSKNKLLQNIMTQNNELIKRYYECQEPKSFWLLDFFEVNVNVLEPKWYGGKIGNSLVIELAYFGTTYILFLEKSFTDSILYSLLFLIESNPCFKYEKIRSLFLSCIFCCVNCVK
jgi:hypothetical protein